ncbi:MAG: hypothetical protein ACRDE5_18760, partial [Ginsengibacter sp.]
AEFGNVPGEKDLPAGIENDFLNYMMAYERQAAERKTIKVFDRLERPTHFKPVNEIRDDEIDSALDELDHYLNKYHIDLAVCSPNISNRELYRFATEELFDYEMNDIFIPGGMTCFTYDEFYPDHKYDNTRHAVEDCINIILEKDPVTWMPLMPSENLRINDHYPLTEAEFKAIVNRFKEAHDDITINEVKDVDFSMSEKLCQVKGVYDITTKLQSAEISLKGNWMVEFNWDGTFWEVVNVQIEGINF